jgi:hypothetical protein
MTKAVYLTQADINHAVQVIKDAPERIQAVIDERDAAVLRLRSGLTIARTAELTELSETTIKVIERTWRARPRKFT